MRAWRPAAPGGSLTLEDIAVPEPGPGTVLVRMQAVPLLSHLGDYVGRLPLAYPPVPFTPGTNGVGTIAALGADIYQFRPRQRVLRRTSQSGDACRDGFGHRRGSDAVASGQSRPVEQSQPDARGSEQ